MRRILITAAIGVSMFIMAVTLPSLALDETGRIMERGSIEVQRNEQTGAGASNASSASSVPPKEGIAANVTRLVYKPPIRGAPGARLAAGTRGKTDKTPIITFLAPDHVGLTVHEQPSLYWLLSEPTSYPVELTIIEAQATRPLLQTRIDVSPRAGLHCIRLADYGVRLKRGIRYECLVALVPDNEQRSQDIIAAAEIECIEPSDAVRARLERESREEAPYAYAEEGLWYDALSAISRLIEAAPGDMNLRKERASMLSQVGLPEIP